MENFNNIYSLYHKNILNFVINRLQDIELSEELTNDIFMKVNKNLHKYDINKSSMKTWIINITKNTIIDYYRKKKLVTVSLNNNHNDDNKNSLIENLKSNIPTPFEIFNTNENLKNIDKIIHQLNKREFEAAYYFFKEELTYYEISKIMQISLGSVKGTIFRARKNLQSKLISI